MPTSKQHQAIYPSHLDIWMCMCLLDKTVIVTDIPTSTYVHKYTPTQIHTEPTQTRERERERERE